jgi:hypothetical protein
LCAARDNKNLDVIKSFLQNGYFNRCESVFGSTPLFYAAARNSVGVVKFFLGYDDINRPNMFGATPLHAAAAFTEDPGVIKFLVDNHADTTKKTKAGATPLDIAAENNKNGEVVIALIEVMKGVPEREDILLKALPRLKRRKDREQIKEWLVGNSYDIVLLNRLNYPCKAPKSRRLSSKTP